MQADLLGSTPWMPANAFEHTSRAASPDVLRALPLQGDGGLAGGEAQAGVLPERFGMRAARITAQAGHPSNGISSQLSGALRGSGPGLPGLPLRWGRARPWCSKLRRLNQLSDQRMQAEAGIDRLQGIRQAGSFSS